ncbi:hypothetical protein QYE76_066704 [Lolium multiflorum]|uniref:Retrotransposon gag domain-containing protein n=1 Tax=Lolium multiflorum TaxID=4521 RepID=A0AAD8SBE3_LOLMU|nr:hypothetical protein QYE76_066704 [Lolium multiflorum]
MAEETQVTYEELIGELKKKYDEVKVLSADLIGSFHETRSHGIEMEGPSPRIRICTILKDQFGMMPKRKAIGYTKPYPNEYELIPLPPKYRLPDFTKFSGSDGSSSIEHVSRYLCASMISASDRLRVRYFSQSLTGSAFGWYTSLPPNSIQTWKQLEERFHEQYHSEASEAGDTSPTYR